MVEWMNDSIFLYLLDEGAEGMWGKDLGAEIEWKRVLGWARGCLQNGYRSCVFLLLAGWF